MSAEPAHTGPGSGTPGQVILFRKRPSVPRTHGQDSPPPAGDLPAASPHLRFARRIEQAYLANGRTLTDPDTAHAYQVAVKVFGDLIEGAHVAGIVDERGHQELHAMIDGMKDAPSLVEKA